MATGQLPPGTLLHGRYRLVGPVGGGGMGFVYKAADIQFGDRLVAVKEMSQDGLSPQEVAQAADNFRREAMLLAGLQHPNLPSVYDHFAEAGHWYLVMDFLEGETLEAHLNRARGGVLPIEEVVRIGEQLCGVLAYLHGRRPPVIFRDLKPANVMLTSAGHLYLIDFGIARLFKPGQALDTMYALTPGYAAPEQYGRAQTDARTDIYSLGATLHQLLTGVDPSLQPFHFPPIRARHPNVPVALDRLVARMVDMDPMKRPPSAVAVGQELFDIAQELAIPGAAAPGARSPSPKPAPQPTPLAALAGILLRIVLGLALLAAISGLAFALWPRSPRQPIASTVSMCATGVVTPSANATPAPVLPPVSGKTVTTTGGLQYIDIAVGCGQAIEAGATVTVQYTGWLQSNGQMFDSSLRPGGQPFQVADVGNAQVIQGWNVGLVGMRLYGERRLIIPASLAYGAQGIPPTIPPNATLIFDVIVVSVP